MGGKKMFFGDKNIIYEPNMFIGLVDVADPDFIADKFNGVVSDSYDPKKREIDIFNIVSFYINAPVKSSQNAFRYDSNLYFLISTGGKFISTNSKTGGDFGFFGRPS